MLFTAKPADYSVNNRMEAFSVNDVEYSILIKEITCFGATEVSCVVSLESVDLVVMDYDFDAGEWVATDSTNQITIISDTDAIVAASKIMSSLIGE